MKMSNVNIETEIDRTLHLLDEMKPLEVNHFFRVRLMQRIEQESEQRTNKLAIGRVSGKLDLRFAFMALLIIINLASAFISLIHTDSPVRAGISEMLDSQGYDYARPAYAYYDQTGTFPSDTENNNNQNP
ncbi:MAG: hypothetical protein HGB36_01985 [Chlorobiaceae bacterium]|nr:hypothetical protein [Chlorobiaceae bacterium]